MFPIITAGEIQKDPRRRMQRQIARELYRPGNIRHFATTFPLERFFKTLSQGGAVGNDPGNPVAHEFLLSITKLRKLRCLSRIRGCVVRG